LDTKKKELEIRDIERQKHLEKQQKEMRLKSIQKQIETEK